MYHILMTSLICLSIGFSIAQQNSLVELDVFSLDELKKRIINNPMTTENIRRADLDNLIPFKSIANLDKIQALIEPLVKQKLAVDFFRIGFPSTNKAYQEAILKRSDFDNWDDQITSELQGYLTRELGESLRNYGDGFFLPVGTWHQAWSTIKIDNGVIGINIRLQPQFPESVNYARREEAEERLGGSVTLVRTLNSLHFQDRKYTLINDDNPPDEFIWVNGTRAIGFYNQRLYQIVNQDGQPLSLLEDEVETRIITKTIAGIDLLQVLVMFDLKALEE